jgi:endonuclease YncB( thermonuclease family)
MKCAAGILALLLATITVSADPIASGSIQVIDADTIRVDGVTVRLVGFDAPEGGSKARCESERALAARATFRLRQLVALGGLDLRLVSCGCRAGTEGTPACNHGRACGVLTAAGRDVGEGMIDDGLARPYQCGPRSCPQRGSWCSE